MESNYKVAVRAENMLSIQYMRAQKLVPRGGLPFLTHFTPLAGSGRPTGHVPTCAAGKIEKGAEPN